MALSPAKRELLKRQLKQEGIGVADTIPKRPDNTVIPLSSAQDRLWSLLRYDLENSSYNSYLYYRISGPIRIPTLDQGIAEIRRRHESVRTRFSDTSGQPVQIVVDYRRAVLPLIDLRLLNPSDLSRVVTDLYEANLNRPFNLRAGPLITSRLVFDNQSVRFIECAHDPAGDASRSVRDRHGHEYHPNQNSDSRSTVTLLLSMHHIIADGWSWGIFCREVGSLYTDFSNGQPSSLSDLPIQYADFVIWQREQFTNHRLHRLRDYWQQKLSGQIPILNLPVDFRRSIAQSYTGSRRSLGIPANVVLQANNLAERQGVTLFVVLLVAYIALLHRLSRLEDIVICSPIVGRNRPEVNNLIGYFNNIVVLRNDLSGDPSFNEILHRTNRVVVDAHENQDFPFQMVSEFPNLKKIPLSRSLFDLQEGADSLLNLPDLTIVDVDVPACTSHFDLSVVIVRKNDGLTINVEYKTCLFRDQTIDQFLQDYQLTLEHIVDQPDACLSGVPSLRKYTPVSAEVNESLDPDESGNCTSPVAARNSYEKGLVEIWERVLGSTPVGITDNFFELGGHSMLAIKLFDEINREYGKKFPLSVLFEAPTIEQLAPKIGMETNEAAGSSLVTIQSAGTLPPLFCIHGGGGEVLIYQQIAKELGKNQPVYGLRPKDWDGGELPQLKVEEMAAQYLEEIRETQPYGPYLIAGFCFGGTVAFEIAQQLHRINQQVSLLVTIDSLRPDYESIKPEISSIKYRSKHHLGKIRMLSPGARMVYIVKRIVHVINLNIARVGRYSRKSLDLLRCRVYFQRGRPLPGDLRGFYAGEHHGTINRRYNPMRYPGKITCFEIENQTCNPQWGWEGLAEGGVEIHNIPGTHNTVFDDANVRELARILSLCIKNSG